MTRRLLAGLLFVCGAGVGQERTGPSLPLEQRVYIASRVYGSLSYFAHAQNAAGLDIDASYKRYLQKVLATEDRFAFSRATMEFLAELRNGHTFFLDRALMQQGGSVPFSATFLSGKWVVSASRAPGLQPGDIIENIDGKPFEQYYASRRAFIAASTEQWARHALFVRAPDFTIYTHLLPDQFVLGLAGGRQVSVNRKAAEPAFPETEGRWIEPEKVAYIRIPSFMKPDFEKRAVELVKQYRSAPALIIDVRGNAGGSTPSELTALLMDRPYRWWTEASPMHLAYFRLRASQGMWQYQPFDTAEMLWRGGISQPAADSYRGKLALLVDSGCHSACEDFTMPFKDTGRAVLAGSTTAGSTGQPYMLDLGDGMMAFIGAKREMFPDGSPFEGVGIKPDVPVSPSPEDLRQGKDVVLEAALKAVAARSGL